jgi:site-specific recombinase XerD
MTFQSEITGFIEYITAKSFSPRTIDAYRLHVTAFAGFLDRYYPRIRRPNEITSEIIDDYQQFIRQARASDERPPANTTVRLKLNAVRALFRYLLERDLVLRDPTGVIVAPKEELRLTRRVPSSDEALEILRSVEPRDATSTRDRAILELLYASAMRTTELCNLKISEVDLKDQTATIVRGKGGKTRIVPIGQYAAYYIELYLRDARKKLLRGVKDDPGNLFLSAIGTPLNRKTINRAVFDKINRRLDGDKRLTCYSFRHASATGLIANGVDIAYVAQLLGHESLETTKRYLKIEIGDLKEQHARFHPRETQNR